MDQEIGALKAEIAKMDGKGQDLNQLLSYFNSESYLEREAKDKLNLKKEGENVVMVQGAAETVGENNNSTLVTAATSAPVEENNFIKWWNFFFKR